jgi:hypothetical protein
MSNAHNEMLPSHTLCNISNMKNSPDVTRMGPCYWAGLTTVSGVILQFFAPKTYRYVTLKYRIDKADKKCKGALFIFHAYHKR